MKAVAALALLGMPSPVAAQSVDDWRPFIVEASGRFGVPTAWVERVMRIESGGRTRRDGRPIVSRAGAMGLMQLMPQTWAALRDLAGLGRDPFDPHDNIVAGTLYLRMLYDRFGYPGLYGAYDAGPSRYTAYLAGKRPLPDETVRYLAAASGPSDTVRSAPLFAPLARADGDRAASAASAGSAGSAGSGSTLFAVSPR